MTIDDNAWGGYPAPTAKPLYEIPVIPPGSTADGWAPGAGVPLGEAGLQPPTFAPPVAPVPQPVAPVEPPVVPPVYVAPPVEPQPPAGPVYSLDDVPPAAPSVPVYSLDDLTPAPRLVPAGRRAAVQPDPTPTSHSAPLPPTDYEAEVATLTAPEREALAKADPELVAALREVVLQRASDLHVTVGAPPMVRIDGALTPAGPAEPWGHERTLAALSSLLTERQAEIFKRELELDFAFTISANSRFRVNFYQQRGSVGAAFRIIPTEIKQLRELGVPEQIGGFSTLPRGLVLVTGPTGSGKSTTLAALIDLVNSTRADHIVTVEDPIEFMHTHKRSIVNQREVGHDTHSFNNALKHVLRQDPDVILIGELRDLETISVALTAAETGHLVFATLHTQDAPQTIDRVIDVFPPHQQDQVRAQLAATLQGVVCQTLVKRASGRGRVVATEVLMMTPAIANLIREGKTYQIASSMQAGRGDGMHTMDQHLAELVNVGAITRKAALEKAHDLESITRLIQRVDTLTDSSSQAIAASEPDFGDSFSGQVR
ncbi:type IV pilus twitching motility protein PilT [Leifsonia aquatica]|uniref:Twitching motility protein n=2 Tax=Leifsonia aquatica TaxID=144185 RepID=U2RW73_LEIAQ|nr:type IV pilus twitching motility protein PilT [Leifsonia aquatica]ERK72779.1 twitching motility protein [Leifsonia aquatica ATCC 14665]MBB2969033.1 twitching motility protein PilT [Leifsonia aquatica]